MFHRVTAVLAALPPRRGSQGCWEGTVTSACFDMMWHWADTQVSQELPEHHNKATAQLQAHELTTRNECCDKLPLLVLLNQ